MFHEPRSKIHWALRVASPLACWAPPRRKECEVKFGVAFALVCASVANLTTRLTYACIFMLSSLGLRFFVRGSLDVSAAVSVSAMAIACSGQVTNLACSGKSDIPCSSNVLTRINLIKTTPSALTVRLFFAMKPRSEARPNAYHINAKRAASW
ncbi:hypothetical protein PHMEG_00015151 [Phytophthora megakarya]|uniref:Uncharacterized protein n=1 Tax=Phytophthora megakarya TaxID=4795 RepID=A0A225W229_9STRA|nr:hypothetical protein PHMEG_00015151 [Phytophthora megakarya]